ncbi:MAG TPA: purine-nucleoside phosphorylase [Gemmatimonadaceae bacterium]
MTGSGSGLPAAQEVARVVRDAVGDIHPVTGLILGSGLGGLAGSIRDARIVSYADLPGFPAPTVPGHAGRLIAGTIDSREVIALSGRFHVYEGHSAALTGFPVRVLRALGATILTVSNAAGGVRRDLSPGDLMIIRDHVNFSWHNPLIGPVVPGDERFPDMSDPYDPALRTLLAECARTLGLRVTDGVYFGLSGPSFETVAEVQMLERLGADAVGMSTVHEVIVARAMGMRVAGVSCITNHAVGLGQGPVNHAEVLAVTEHAGAVFERLVIEFVRRLP